MNTKIWRDFQICISAPLNLQDFSFSILDIHILLVPNNLSKSPLSKVKKKKKVILFFFFSLGIQNVTGMVRSFISTIQTTLIKKKVTNLRKFSQLSLLKKDFNFKKDLQKIFKNTREGFGFLVMLKVYNIQFTSIGFLRIFSNQTASWKKYRNSILTVEL